MKRTRNKTPIEYKISPDELTEIIRDNTPKFQKSWQQKRPYASQSLCARLSTLNAQIPEHWIEREPAMNFYAKSGNAMEEAVNKVLEKAGLFICTGWKLQTELFENLFDIGGKIDTLLWVNDGKDLAIIEQKCVGHVEKANRITLNRSEIDALKEGNQIILNNNDSRVKSLPAATPKQSYKAQAEIYSAITGIDTTFIGMFSRNIVDNWNFDEKNHISHKFFTVDISDENLAKRVASVIYTNWCNTRGYIAEMPKGIVKSHCNGAFCPFMEFCWGDEPESIYSLPKKPLNLEMIDHQLSLQWKKEAYELALNYVSRRPERYQKMITLLKQLPSKKKN